MKNSILKSYKNVSEEGPLMLEFEPPWLICNIDLFCFRFHYNTTDTRLYLAHIFNKLKIYEFFSKPFFLSFISFYCPQNKKYPKQTNFFSPFFFKRLLWSLHFYAIYLQVYGPYNFFVWSSWWFYYKWFALNLVKSYKNVAPNDNKTIRGLYFRRVVHF